MNVNRSYTANGLNQYTLAGTAAFCYDANGNLTADGAYVYLYDIENRLVEKRVQVNTNCAALAYTGALQAVLRYDPMGRLHETTGSATTRYLTDGDALVAEYDGAGALLRRYVHGADGQADDPVAWYEGAAMNGSTLRFLHPDRQGSVTLAGDSADNTIRIFKFDEYGIPQSGDGAALTPANGARFLYTGQAFLPELGMYYYKARMYSPTLGRFMQTDPIGYEDQINLYAYVGNDPVNRFDPTGEDDEIVVTGRRSVPFTISILPQVVIPGTPQNQAWARPIAQRLTRILKTCLFLCAEEATGDDPSEAGKGVIEGDGTKEDKQIDNRGKGRSVTDVIGKAAEAAGVTPGTTKDGKPTVVFPDGSRATGYPASTTTGGPSIEIRGGGGKVRSKTREDFF